MTTRQFYQHAQAYGSVQATVTVTLDGNTIYAGPVPTVDQPQPMLPDPDYRLPLAWSWEGTCEFAGALPLTIAVQGSELILGDTSAQAYDQTGNLSVIEEFFKQNIDGQEVADCFTDVKIDGIEMPVRGATPIGPWWWRIPTGSQFEAILNINASVPPEPPAETP